MAVDQWREQLTTGLVPDLSVYNVKDYRRFLSAHIQFLTGLCNLSVQSVNASVSQLFSSLFVSTQLQSPVLFQTHIDSLVAKSKSNATATFARLLSLFRAINHGNAVISTYGTNYEYFFVDYRYMGYSRGKDVCCSKMR